MGPSSAGSAHVGQVEELLPVVLQLFVRFVAAAVVLALEHLVQRTIEAMITRKKMLLRPMSAQLVIS